MAFSALARRFLRNAASDARVQQVERRKQKRLPPVSVTFSCL
jgi:hypothetical protein